MKTRFDLSYAHLVVVGGFQLVVVGSFQLWGFLKRISCFIIIIHSTITCCLFREMENRKKVKMVTDADERFARIETYFAEFDNRQSRLEKSIEEMQAMFTDFMSTSRRAQATETRSNIPTHFNDRVEVLPVFDGVDPIGWIIRANSYFEYRLTPEKDKVECGLVCMESLAPRWANWVRQNQPNLTWAQLCATVVERYDGRFKKDVIERICKLEQTGDIEEYIGDFVRTIAQLSGIPDSHCVGLFLQGLRLEEVRTKLRVLGLKNLETAIVFARDIEDDFTQFNFLLSPPALIENETHRGNAAHSQVDEEDYEDSSGYGAFKLRGRIRNEEAIVLISTASNRSCVSSSLADRLNLKRSDSSRFKGQFFIGHVVNTKGICRGVRLSMGSCSFVVDLFVLDLGLSDVILGRDWMDRLGEVRMFGENNTLHMSFDWKGENRRLSSERGLTKGPECGSVMIVKEENGSFVMA